MSQVDPVAEFYKEFDICMDIDMFDYFYIYDPLLIFTSPSFPNVTKLEEWLLPNMDNLRKMLE